MIPKIPFQGLLMETGADQGPNYKTTGARYA